MSDVLREVSARLKLEVDKSGFSAAEKALDKLKTSAKQLTDPLKEAARAHRELIAHAREAARVQKQYQDAVDKAAREKTKAQAAAERQADKEKRARERADRAADRERVKSERERMSAWRSYWSEMRSRHAAGQEAIAAANPFNRIREDLGGQVGTLIGVAGAVEALRLAKQAFIDWNDWIEQTTISLAAQKQMLKGGGWSEAMTEASGLFEHYQEVAKKSVGETKDFIEMHTAISAAAYQAGASLEQIKDLTKGAVIGSHVLGESPFTSAMDIKQALTKGVEVRDRFANMLLASQNVTAAKFNAMKKAQRIEVLRAALTAPAIQNAAKEMERSFAGAFSTLKDTIQIALGKVGKPLFDDLKANLNSINDWMEKNKPLVEGLMSFAKSQIGELIALMKLLRETMEFCLGPLLDLVNAVAKLEGKSAKDSSLVATFKAITEPIQTAYDLLQDIGYFLTGKASFLGQSIAKARGPEALSRYTNEVYYGGKEATLFGGVAGEGERGGIAGAMLGMGEAVKRLIFPVTALTDRFRSLTSVVEALSPILGIGRGVGDVLTPNAPGPTASYDTGQSVQPETSLWDRLGNGLFNSQPVIRLPWSKSGGQSVAVDGAVSVKVQVEVPDGSKFMSEEHRAELRGAGAIMSGGD